jgi:hypothetical protein
MFENRSFVQQVFNWGSQSPFQGEGDWEVGQKVLMV